MQLCTTLPRKSIAQMKTRDTEPLCRPKVTTLYALKVPAGEPQVCRYDDGTGDELPVPLGTTAFVSGATMFDILPPAHKSLAVRSKVKYAPHPYVWMAPAHAMSTGLGIESEGLELPLNELPPWEEAKIKIFPVVSKRSCMLWRSDSCLFPACTALEEPRYGWLAFPGSPMRRGCVDRRSTPRGGLARGRALPRWCGANRPEAGA